MFTSTGEGLSVPPQGSETLWSLSFLLGTSDKELGGSSGVSNTIQRLHLLEVETKAQRNLSLVSEPSGS